MSDRLALAHAIEDAGIPRDKAESVATAIARFVEGSAATKADVERAEAALKANIDRVEVALKADIDRAEAALKANIDYAETALKADIQKVRTDLQADIARLDGRIDRLDAKVEQIGGRTFNRLGALVAIVATLLFAALHVWPPH
jgi:tRNA U34 5-carboxymethylaminomethyl modifying GTPase MnmE/TrmE